jgi:mono/diheme cytochrome c family protein
MRAVFIVGLCLIVVAIVGLCGCPPKVAVPPVVAPVKPADAPASPAASTPAPDGGGDLALGEKIAREGLGENGQHVAFTGGSDRFKEKPGGCLGCHNDQGQGRKTEKGEIPAITYAALCGGDKPDFPSDDLVVRAIREGKDEEGESLAAAMPRWQLSDKEAAALILFLKELDKAAPAATEAKPAAPAS